MGELADPIEVGQVYLDTADESTAEVEQIFVDEAGETQIRLEIRNRGTSSIILVDVDTFVERVDGEELLLESEANWRV